MNKPIELREADFKRAVFEQKYPKEMLEEFFDYWTERSTKGIKMRFEMEKTWSLSRRLGRWANNGFSRDFKGKSGRQKPEIKTFEAMNVIEKLDAFLAQYGRNPSSVNFESLAEWFDFLKEARLLKTFTREEVGYIQAAYNNDKVKCRSACVQKTMEGYINSGMRFSDILKVRANLDRSAAI